MTLSQDNCREAMNHQREADGRVDFSLSISAVLEESVARRDADVTPVVGESSSELLDFSLSDGKETKGLGATRNRDDLTV